MDNQEKEEWRPIPGFAKYKVSNYGNVANAARGNILNPFIIAKYPAVNVSRDSGKRRTMYVHHLVAMAFMDHFPHGHDVVINHIDGDTENNNLSNLELTSHRKNILLGFETKLGENHFRGVTLVPRGKRKYKASARKNGKMIYLGVYADPYEAAEVYRKFIESLNEGNDPLPMDPNRQ